VIARAVELVRETCAEERETSESVEQLFSGWSGGRAMGILMARSFVSLAHANKHKIEETKLRKKGSSVGVRKFQAAGEQAICPISLKINSLELRE